MEIPARIRNTRGLANMPTTSPLVHLFMEWRDWSDSVVGRRLRYFVENLLRNYLALFP